MTFIKGKKLYPPKVAGSVRFSIVILLFSKDMYSRIPTYTQNNKTSVQCCYSDTDSTQNNVS